MLRLYKRGDIYHIRGTVSYAGSSQRVRCTTGQANKRSAEEVCRRIEEAVLSKMRGGENLAPFTLEVENWLSITRGKTDARNAVLLNKVFGAIPVSRIDAAAWTKFRSRKLRGCSEAHVNRIRATLVSILNHAAAPVDIPRLRENNMRVRFLTYEEQETLLAAYPDFIRPYFICLAYQGFRRQEALDLKWQWVNTDARTITLPFTKNGTMRIVPAHPRVLDTMERRHPVFVYPNKDGQPYAFGDSLKGIHRRACLSAGISDFTIHDWRHHWASRLVMNVADLPRLMKLGGWRSEKMVLRYAAVSDRHITDTLLGLT